MRATFVVWERGGWGDDGLGATTTLLGVEVTLLSMLLSSSQASKGLGGKGWQRDNKEGKMGRHVYAFVINVDFNVNAVNSNPLLSVLPSPANKACDFSFVISPGCAYWLSDMFEPLWVGILLPFVKHRPWCLKRAPLLLEVGRELRSVLQTDR